MWRLLMQLRGEQMHPQRRLSKVGKKQTHFHSNSHLAVITSANYLDRALLPVSIVMPDCYYWQERCFEQLSLILDLSFTMESSYSIDHLMRSSGAIAFTAMETQLLRHQVEFYCHLC